MQYLLGSVILPTSPVEELSRAQADPTGCKETFNQGPHRGSLGLPCSPFLSSLSYSQAFKAQACPLVNRMHLSFQNFPKVLFLGKTSSLSNTVQERGHRCPRHSKEARAQARGRNLQLHFGSSFHLWILFSQVQEKQRSHSQCRKTKNWIFAQARDGEFTVYFILTYLF